MPYFPSLYDYCHFFALALRSGYAAQLPILLPRHDIYFKLFTFD